MEKNKQSFAYILAIQLINCHSDWSVWVVVSKWSYWTDSISNSTKSSKSNKMGNLCFKGEDSDGENRYLAGGQRVSAFFYQLKQPNCLLICVLNCWLILFFSCIQILSVWSPHRPLDSISGLIISSTTQPDKPRLQQQRGTSWSWGAGGGCRATFKGEQRARHQDAYGSAEKQSWIAGQHGRCASQMAGRIDALHVDQFKSSNKPSWQINCVAILQESLPNLRENKKDDL